MIDLSVFPIFLAGALALNLAPGPDVAFTMASAIRGGRRAGFAAALGIGAGSLVWSALAAAGIATLLAASEHALTIIRIAGGLYLLALAAKTIESLDDAFLAEARGASGAGRAFRDGIITNLLNPKVGLFFIAFLPAFTNAQVGPIWAQALILGAVFSLTGALALFVYAAAAGAARARLQRSRTLRRLMAAAAATAFGALGFRLLLTRPA